jgi:hypothetical protein
VSTGPTACIYVATCTRPTVRHVYSDRTRGELQVAKNNFFCSVNSNLINLYRVHVWFVGHIKKCQSYSHVQLCRGSRLLYATDMKLPTATTIVRGCVRRLVHLKTFVLFAGDKNMHCMPDERQHRFFRWTMPFTFVSNVI